MDRELYFQPADEIRIENFRRDLTKRQKAVVWMIHLYSISMGKDIAYIPQLKDFELCGVAKTKIKSELEVLVDYNIIEWNKEENTFKINDIETWGAPINKYWQQDRHDQLVMLNQKHNKFD